MKRKEIVIKYDATQLFFCLEKKESKKETKKSDRKNKQIPIDLMGVTTQQHKFLHFKNTFGLM